MKIKRILIHSLLGGFIGYFILHPASMLICDLTKSSFSFRSQPILTAFSFEHLDMAIFFTLLGIIIGVIHALYIEKIVKNINKIEVLEGLLPICSWCNKIRDDSVTGNDKWIPIDTYIDTYILKKSKANFTHGLCPDCEKQQLEEINKLYIL